MHVFTLNPSGTSDGYARIVALLAGLLISLMGCSSARPSSESGQSAPGSITVARIGASTISLSEFQEQYERTSGLESTAPEDTLAAYKDFLQRYVDFKLKVMHAREAGYGDLPDLKAEISGYRNQLARPYLLEEAVTTPLMREIYTRRNEMVEASHILIRVAPNADPADTLAAYERLNSIADSVRSGADFGEMAARHSEDPSARSEPGNPGSRGYLGFFGGGRMVSEFEDAAYSTAPGSISPIVRTQFGYHLILVHDRQPLPGDIRLAHIMIQVGGPSAPDSASALARVQEIQDKLDAGEDFAALAQEYSDDRGSASSGGELQRLAFDAGLPSGMRDAAYGLEPGQVSGPIESPFGFHFIKVLERFEKETYEEAYDRLSSQVAQMPRAKAAEKAFARSKRIERGGRVDTARVEALLALHADSVVAWIRTGDFSPEQAQSPIAYLADSTYTLARFASSFQPSISASDTRGSDQIWSGLEQFLDERAMEYEIAALDENNEAFARTMREFRDGLMLFRLMEDSVWTAASIDSVALEAFYEPRADQYRFPDRYRVISISNPTDSTLSVIAERIGSGETIAHVIEAFAQDSLSTIRVDTTFVQGETNSVFDAALSLSEGQTSGPVAYNNGYVLLYHGGMDPARVKTFEEARAQAVNDYQAVLEENLMRRLREKYRVETYPDRLMQLVKRSAEEESGD